MLYDYLDDILNTVQFKDAAVRLGISNIAALETATRYLFDSVDNLVNPKSIADVMTSMGTKISSLTIFNYLKGLQLRSSSIRCGTMTSKINVRYGRNVCIMPRIWVSVVCCASTRYVIPDVCWRTCCSLN